MKSILTMVMHLYNMAFTGGRQRGYAAAIAFALFAMVLIFSLIIFRAMAARGGRDTEKEIRGV